MLPGGRGCRGTGGEATCNAASGRVGWKQPLGLAFLDLPAPSAGKHISLSPSTGLLPQRAYLVSTHHVHSLCFFQMPLLRCLFSTVWLFCLAKLPTSLPPAVFPSPSSVSPSSAYAVRMSPTAPHLAPPVLPATPAPSRGSS